MCEKRKRGQKLPKPEGGTAGLWKEALSKNMVRFGPHAHTDVSCAVKPKIPGLGKPTTRKASERCSRVTVRFRFCLLLLPCEKGEEEQTETVNARRPSLFNHSAHFAGPSGFGCNGAMLQ